MLKDKVIVVTGASRGIGEAIARACIEGGAKVALASRKQADLDRVVASLPPEQAIALACHTGKAEDVAETAQQTAAAVDPTGAAAASVAAQTPPVDA